MSARVERSGRPGARAKATACRQTRAGKGCLGGGTVPKPRAATYVDTGHDHKTRAPTLSDRPQYATEYQGAHPSNRGLLRHC